MKWKSMFITIVLNIFLMLLITVMMEYVDLTDRMNTVQDTIKEALDSAIQSAVGSEEFFTAEVQEQVTSFGITTGKQTSSATTTLWLKDDKKFYACNTYGLAYYFEKTGELPTRAGQVTSALNEIRHENLGIAGGVYKWLFGGVGQSFTSQGWGVNMSKKVEYENFNLGNNRTMSSDFAEYYHNVGYMVRTSGYLKSKSNGSTSYTMILKDYPTLYNMGFADMSSNASGEDKNLTDGSSTLRNDNFITTYHIGKAVYGQKKSVYFLTPASLGVTYVPVKVLKPAFVSTLDTLVRLRMANMDTANETDFKETMANASKCIDTDVYTDTGGSLTQAQHKATKNIVTDGNAEFELDSTKVKVDYFVVNFADNTYKAQNEIIATKINGAVQSYSGGKPQYNQSESRKKTLSSFISQDTANYVTSFNNTNLFNNSYNKLKNTRIVARVSVRIKVHVPYKSAIMQWACQLTSRNNADRPAYSGHYDIKLFDPASGMADWKSDGIWFSYTTYYCTTRS